MKMTFNECVVVDTKPDLPSVSGFFLGELDKLKINIFTGNTQSKSTFCIDSLVLGVQRLSPIVYVRNRSLQGVCPDPSC